MSKNLLLIETRYRKALDNIAPIIPTTLNGNMNPPTMYNTEANQGPVNIVIFVNTNKIQRSQILKELDQIFIVYIEYLVYLTSFPVQRTILSQRKFWMRCLEIMSSAQITLHPMKQNLLFLEATERKWTPPERHKHYRCKPQGQRLIHRWNVAMYQSYTRIFVRYFLRSVQKKERK